MRNAGLLALAALAVAACQDNPAAPAAQDAPDAPELIADQYIVVYRDGVANPGALTTSLAAASGAKVTHRYAAALQGFAGRMSRAAAEELARDARVKYVEQDQVVHAVATQSGATWGLDRIDQRSGLSTSYTYNATGAGVTAYIIDTGIETTHPEFGGRASIGTDKVGDGRNGQDCNGHGTHVAGTVGGTTWGVAKNVTLVAVRVLDCGGSGSWSGVIAGMDWVAANHSGPSVANMSLGGGASTAVDDGLRRMIASGVASAVAAGNGNFIGIAQDACKSSPARVAEAMTIGATDKADKKTSWSNYGTCVDWFAPGSGITSAWINGGTNTISGTSMATPHVAGVAALFLEGNPSASPQQVRDALYAATTKGVVTSAKTANNHLLFTAY